MNSRQDIVLQTRFLSIAVLSVILAVDEVVFHQVLDRVRYLIRITYASGGNHGL